MEITKEQQLFQQVINEAWENESFKKELMTAPVAAIEKLTGEKVSLPAGKTLVVRDQTDAETVFINIPAAPATEDVELNEAQLEAVAGGIYAGIQPGLPIIELGPPQIFDLDGNPTTPKGGL